MLIKKGVRAKLRRIQKSQPTAGDLHVNVPLTNVSVAYMQDQSIYVADKVFPVVPVDHQSGLYWEYNREDFLRDEARVRAPGTQSAGGGFKVSTSPYAALVEAFHKDVDDQTRANADNQFNLDKSATDFVTQKMLIRRERRWASNFFTSGIWGTDVTPSVLWDTALSDPMQDVETGRITVSQYAGFEPNTLVLGAQVMSALKTNARIRDQFKYTSAESIDEAMIARYFNVDRVLVMKAVYVPTVEGGTPVTTSFIGGKNALLCYTTPSPSLLTPTAGYIFGWSGYIGSVGGVRVKKFRMEPEASDRVEGEMAYDMHKVTAAMGYMLNGVIS